MIMDRKPNTKDRCRPVRTFPQRPLRAEENLMPCQTLQREGPCRKLTVLIIVLIWVIMTLRTGPDWLTPMEIAFCALLLGAPSPVHRSISG
jgi:hypothetical protein